MMRWRCLWVFLGVIGWGIEGLYAQDDAYHQGLRAQLQQDYNLTGGTWVFSGDENATLQRAQLSLVNKTTGTAQGLPFTRYDTYTNATARSNPWDSAIRFPIAQPIQQGDALLLVFWVRGVQSSENEGQVDYIFELTRAPWTKSLSQTRTFRRENGWQQWLVPFEAAESYGLGDGRFQINMGYLAQTFDIGGLAILNYGSQYSVDDLPQSSFHLDYEGRAPDAAWRSAAAARIADHRMGDLQVRVVDANGEPIEGATVDVAMNRHAFGFGTAVAIDAMTGGRNGVTYREKLSNLAGDGRTFSIAVLENALKWGAWRNPWFEGDEQEVVSRVAWLKSHGMEVRGHNAIWPGWQYMPNEMEANQNNTSFLLSRIEDRIRDVMGYPGIKGEILEWDVINEIVHVHDVKNAIAGRAGYPTGREVYAEWFQIAAEADPETKLFINEYSIVSGGGRDLSSQESYKELIQFIRDNGGRIDGIGIQGHVGSTPTPPEHVYALLDEFAALDAAISITEYDAMQMEENIAGDYMRDFLTMVFSHPATTSFLMWGFWDGAHWGDDAPIFREDWSLKPSGEAFIDLVFNQWWTDEVATTNDTGHANVRGYYGDYTVTARHGNLEATATFAHRTEGNTIDVQLNGIGTGIDQGNLPTHFQLDGNYPNPFNPATTIRYALPTDASIRLAIYDTLGREQAVLMDGPQQAGWHNAFFDATDLPSGIYIYRLEADGFSKSNTMLLVK